MALANLEIYYFLCTAFFPSSRVGQAVVAYEPILSLLCLTCLDINRVFFKFPLNWLIYLIFSTKLQKCRCQMVSISLGLDCLTSLICHLCSLMLVFCTIDAFNAGSYYPFMKKMNGQLNRNFKKPRIEKLCFVTTPGVWC